jgi:hypothetical protein
VPVCAGVLPVLPQPAIAHSISIAKTTAMIPFACAVFAHAVLTSTVFNGNPSPHGLSSQKGYYQFRGSFSSHFLVSMKNEMLYCDIPEKMLIYNRKGIARFLRSGQSLWGAEPPLWRLSVCCA